MITNYPYSAVRGFCKAIYGDVPLLITPTVYPLLFGSLATDEQKTLTAQINANCDFLLFGFASASNITLNGLF